MTDPTLSDVVAVSVADGLSLVRFESVNPTWEGKADEWAATLVDIDHRLADLAHRVGADVTPPADHWNKAQREATVEAIAVNLDADDAVALRRAFGL